MGTRGGNPCPLLSKCFFFQCECLECPEMQEYEKKFSDYFVGVFDKTCKKVLLFLFLKIPFSLGYFSLTTIFIYFFENHPFQAILITKTYIFIIVKKKYIMSVKAYGGGAKGYTLSNSLKKNV